MVAKPEEYPYSGHCSYLGLAPAGIVDVDPVLRHFGAKKELAREVYREFVYAGMKRGHHEEFYPEDDARILGTEEFVDATIHQIGETMRPSRRANADEEFNAEALIEAVEKTCRVPRADFCSSAKRAGAVKAREMLVLIGCELGATLKALSEITGLSSSAVSRRHDAVRLKMRENEETSKLAARIRRKYRQG